jgi:hypothetical protein
VRNRAISGEFTSIRAILLSSRSTLAKIPEKGLNFQKIISEKNRWNLYDSVGIPAISRRSASTVEMIKPIEKQVFW